MLVRIVVLNWNGSRWLDACLASLAGEVGPGVEVVVVDNQSTDGSVNGLEERFPAVRVLRLETNTGFARGNNQGAAGATAKYLAFLNNDTEVEPGWIPALVSAAERDAGAAVVTSRIVYMDRPDVIDSAGDGYLRCGGAFKRAHGQPAASAPGSGEVFGACGAGFLIRRDLFERIGGFDESFFMVYEDVDLSYRARLHGARVVYAADATVRHAGSASMGRASTLSVFHGQRNLEWTWIQNTPSRLLWRSALAHAAYDCAGFLGYARHGHAWTWLRAKAAALAGLPRVLARRREIQRTATADPDALWRLMEPDWIRLKKQEKKFDLGN